MVSDNLINVIAGLVKREGRIAREDAKKAKDALKAEAEKDDEEEDDEDEDPVGDPAPAGKDTDTKPEPEEKPADGGGEGEPDNKPTGPDPALVAQIAAIIKKEIKDEEKSKKEKEIKLSGKKEKIDTTPTMKQEGRMNFREAVRKSITGSPLAEGYESHVLEILNDENIDGPLGYEPFFENGKLYVMKGQEGQAKKALKNSREVSKLPKIVGEELEPDEYLAMESVSVDGRLRGFKEALKRLTYEKIKQMKEKEAAKAKTEEIEFDDGKLTDEESELQKKYKEYYEKMIAKYGVKSPAELDDDKKKEFFNALNKGWKEGEGPVKEEFEDFEEFLVNMIAVDEKKMTAQAKQKAALYRRSSAGKKAIKKYLKKSKKPGYRVDKQLAKAMKKSGAKAGISGSKKKGVRQSFEPEGEEQIEEARTPVSVDGRGKGFKEAITRLSFEKLSKLHDKAKAEEIRRSEERWSSESVEEMRGQKKIEIEEAVNLKKLKKEFEKNEDQNYHSENYLLLAKAFGTKSEIKHVEEILKRNEKQGSTSQKDNDWMYKNIMPYYRHLRNEEVEIDEVVNFSKMSDDKLKAFIAGFDSDEPMGQTAGMQLKAAKKEASKRGIKEEVELGETVELQIVMALDDVGIVASEITPKEVTVKKKEVKKAEAALKKSFKGKKVPKVIGEERIISAYDKIKGIRKKIIESFDHKASVELKQSIENGDII